MKVDGAASPAVSCSPAYSYAAVYLATHDIITRPQQFQARLQLRCRSRSVAGRHGQHRLFSFVRCEGGVDALALSCTFPCYSLVEVNGFELSVPDAASSMASSSSPASILSSASTVPTSPRIVISDWPFVSSRRPLSSTAPSPSSPPSLLPLSPTDSSHDLHGRRHD